MRPQGRWQQSLCTGLVFGALWGAAEAGLHQLSYVLPVWSATGVWLPVDPLGALAILFQAALRYAAVAVVLTPLLALALGWLVGGRERTWAAPRALLTVVLFLNLYWWTKKVPWLAFHAGLPFTHPSRLLLSAGFAVLALLLAVLLVGPGRLGLPSRRLTGAVLLLMALGGGWAEVRESRLAAHTDRPAPVGDAPNVVLVVVDALRADRLGCYGYDVRDPPTSPHLDAMAEQGVVFEKAVVQAPFTWTSFGSFLTGKYPREHGLMNMRPNQRLDPKRNRTLAQALQEEGWITGAFLTGTLSNNSGLLHGFDTYFETIVGHEPVTRSSKWSIVRSDLLLSIYRNKIRQKLDDRLVNTEAMNWIRAHHERPFFALVHYYTTHTTYDPPDPWGWMYDPDYDGPYHPFTQSHNIAITKGFDGYEWTERDTVHLNALYDGCVAYADDMFGDLLALLDELDLADDTLVVFTSDHGEELYDHQVFEHDWMFNTNLYVPLVMRFPEGRFAGSRVPWHVEAMDIPASVVDVAGRGTLDPGRGRSLLPDAGGEEPPEGEGPVFSENNRYIAMIDGRYKLKVRRDGRSAPMAFDLHEDPDELQPLEDEALLARLMERYRVYEASQPAIDSLPTFEEDPELEDRLRQLGYIDGYLGPNEMNEEELYRKRLEGADREDP